MKKLLLLSAIAFSCLLYSRADAQIGFHVGIRFHAPRVIIAPPVVAAQPVVYEQPAPVAEDQVYTDQAPVYDNTGDDYYYLPDVDAYYDVNAQCYFYNDGTNWISAAYLPGAYANFDWRSARHFEIRGTRPYLHDDIYRSRYNGRQVAAFASKNNDYRNNGGYSNQGFHGYDQRFNRTPERPAQQVQANRDNFNRPAPQQNRGNAPRDENRGRDMRGGNEHLAQNNQANYAGHRLSKF
jgi:hypothetical protein